jgi:hypothetical protein
MKTIHRCLLSISLVLIFSTFSYSQVRFGVKSGINIATMKDINNHPKNRLGWYGGGFANIHIHKKIVLQPELFFSGKGYKYIGNLNENEKSSSRINYLTGSVLLGYKIDNKTSMFLGPEVGYLVSAHNIWPTKQAFNVYKNYPTKLDIGLDIGLSYTVLNNVGLEIRYSYGFKSIYRTDEEGIQIGDVLA